MQQEFVKTNIFQKSDNYELGKKKKKASLLPEEEDNGLLQGSVNTNDFL